jgi:hypothetical protein
MSVHPHLWLWLWFLFGMFVYMLKRAYYLVTGPNPVANSYGQFVQRCWIPLFVRSVLDSGIYWLSFYPELFNQALTQMGISWQLHSAIPQAGVVALFAGLFVDSVVDFLVSKVPYIKDWMPQMPGPLKPCDPPAPEQGKA